MKRVLWSGASVGDKEGLPAFFRRRERTVGPDWPRLRRKKPKTKGHSCRLSFGISQGRPWRASRTCRNRPIRGWRLGGRGCRLGSLRRGGGRGGVALLRRGPQASTEPRAGSATCRAVCGARRPGRGSDRLRLKQWRDRQAPAGSRNQRGCAGGPRCPEGGPGDPGRGAEVTFGAVHEAPCRPEPCRLGRATGFSDRWAPSPTYRPSSRDIPQMILKKPSELRKISLEMCVNFHKLRCPERAARPWGGAPYEGL